MMVYIILHIVISILKLNLNLLIIRITTFRKIFLITNVNQFIMMKINTILKCFLEKYMYNVLEENKQFLFQYKYWKIFKKNSGKEYNKKKQQKDKIISPKSLSLGR